MATMVRNSAWRDLWASGLLGRFTMLCAGVWLHAADTLVTATVVPAVVDDIGGVAYVGWTISLYQVGGIIAGAATALLPAAPPGRAATARFPVLPLLVLSVATLLIAEAGVIARVALSAVLCVA